MNPIRLREHIRCRLFLYSVLGAMPKLLRLVPEARDILGDQRFSLRFSTRSGLQVTLAFEDGQANFHADADVSSDMSLFFVSDTQANKLFTQRGLSMPVPVRGLLQMRKLRVFKELSDLLQRYLKPSAQDLARPDFREVHVNIMLGLVVRALCQICMHEPESRALVLGGPLGLATFSLGREQEPAWILCDEERFDSGFGELPREADVHVFFKDSRIALEALEDRVDVNAAVGLGLIRVQGLAPLADNLGQVMQRISHYLEPKAQELA